MTSFIRIKVFDFKFFLWYYLNNVDANNQSLLFLLFNIFLPIFLKFLLFILLIFFLIGSVVLLHSKTGFRSLNLDFLEQEKSLSLKL